MKRMLLIVGLTVLIAYGALCMLMWLKQRSLMYAPTPAQAHHANAPTLQVPAQGSDVPAATLRLALRAPADAAPGAPALIYFGGNAEDVSASLPGLAQAFPGHAIHGLHYRGYSGSSGSPTEAALHADALALYDQVQRLHPQITLVGRSLGSGIAVRLATLRPVQRLVLVTPYHSLREVAERSYPYLPVRWLLKDGYEAWRDAPRVTAPTRLLLAGQDRLIPPEHGQALAREFRPGIASVRVLDQAGHNDIAEFADYPALLNSSR